MLKHFKCVDKVRIDEAKSLSEWIFKNVFKGYLYNIWTVHYIFFYYVTGVLMEKIYD